MLTKDIPFGMNILTLGGFVVMGLTLNAMADKVVILDQVNVIAADSRRPPRSWSALAFHEDLW